MTLKELTIQALTATGNCGEHAIPIVMKTLADANARDARDEALRLGVETAIERVYDAQRRVMVQRVEGDDWAAIDADDLAAMEPLVVLEAAERKRSVQRPRLCSTQADAGRRRSKK